MPTRSSYPYSLVRRIINAKIGGRLSAVNSAGDTGSDTNQERDLINSAVRVALSDIDFRGNLRDVTLTPNLMENQYDYALPLDVKADKIVDFHPQVTDSRGFYEEYNLVSPEEFDRRKRSDRNAGLYTIINDDLTRKLRISANVDDQTLVISDMNSVNDQDTWGGFGNTSDTAVLTDDVDFVHGSGAIRFTDTVVGVGDSIIGIENSALNPFDISPFLAKSSFFYNVRLDTGDTGVKNFRLRLGSDSNNFHEFNDSTVNDCSAPVAGWNLIRLDASTRATTGTVVDTAIDYAALAIDRDSGTHLDTDFGFDHLIAKKGRFYQLSYYTRFIWQDTAFALSENSSHDSHALMVQNDELEVITAKGAELASVYLRNSEDREYYRQEYEKMKETYLMNNPSQANPMTKTYYNFSSLDDTTLITSHLKDS